MTKEGNIAVAEKLFNLIGQRSEIQTHEPIDSLQKNIV
jgi:hypothetical protein